MSSAFLRNEGSRQCQNGSVRTKSHRLGQRRFQSAAVAEVIRKATCSNVMLLPCLAAAGLTAIGARCAHAATNIPTQWDLVGALDPNATANGATGGTATNVVDLPSNNTSTGMNLANFTSSVQTAFTNNLGGVFNFEAYGATTPSEITQLAESNASYATGAGPGGATPKDVEGFTSGGAFTAGSGIGTVAIGSVTSGTPLIGFYLTGVGGATTVAINTNTTTASGGGIMGMNGQTSFAINFEPASGYGVSSFGLTEVSRAGANSGTMTASFSGGGTAVSNTSTGSASNYNGNFIGFNAPSGQFITSVSWALASGSIARWDDAAFILSALPAGTNYYWTGVSSTNWSASNWSTSAAGSPATTLSASGAEAVFTASNISSSTITTSVDTAQSVYGITVNPSDSVTIGGAQSLTIGAGGIIASSNTGSQAITTTGGVVIGNLQTWTVNNTLIVSAPLSGTASITFNGSGMTVLSHSNSYSGMAVVSSGILQLGNSLALGSASAQVNGGLLDLGGSATLASLASNGAAAGGTVSSSAAGLSTLTITGVNTVGYGGAINDSTGQVAVVVNTGATLTLADNNISNYSGGTTILPGGTLNVGVQAGYVGYTPDRTIGVGPLTLGSASGAVATIAFGTQAGGGATTHTFNNSISVLGNTLIRNVEGVNQFAGPILLNGSNNTLSNQFIDKPTLFAGPISGSGSLLVTGFGNSSNGTYGGGGYLGIGNTTTAVDNTGFTGIITVDNVVTADHNKGVQIVASQNALLPNGVLAFTADLPVLNFGPSGMTNAPSNANGPIGSAVLFVAAVTAPQIGALSSSNGGGIALVTQGSSNTSFGSGVNLTLGLNIATSNSYNGNLYDDPTAPGSLTKIGINTQVLTGTNTYIGGTNVAGGTLTFASPKAFSNFTNLTIGANASAGAANFGTGSKNNLFASGLSIAGVTGAWTGKLDLANNDMVVQNGSLATLTNQVAQGFNGGGWNGSGGILSSVAAADTTHLHAVGVIQNSADGRPTGVELYSAATSNAFDAATADAATDVLLKYTYYGDTNLDGKVDGSDYSRIDANFAAGGTLTGWYNGDFNYDNVVNGSDYTLIDNAFNAQGSTISASLAGPLATSTAEIAGGSSAVPEPTSIGLLGIGLLGLGSRRRRLARK